MQTARRASALGLLALTLALGPGALARASILQPAESCPVLEQKRAFVQFLDPLLYALLPGGTFEAGAPAWTLRDATIADGNEPFHVNDATDARSLRLPPGSSATSPSFCARADTPTLRFFARSDGSRLEPLAGTLKVEALAVTARGRVLAIPLGTVEPIPYWLPTRPFLIGANALAPSWDDVTPVAFRFTPIGSATWLIDDVYVDPFRRS